MIQGRCDGSSANASQSGSWRIACDCEPSDPHTTGPMPVTSLGPTTTAPAPSPKMKRTLRSVGSVLSLMRSTPMTST